MAVLAGVGLLLAACGGSSSGSAPSCEASARPLTIAPNTAHEADFAAAADAARRAGRGLWSRCPAG